jgi:hypothetical protein
MLGTLRPARIDERVVQLLLHVVNDSLLEIRGIVGKHSNPRHRLFHRHVMAGTEGGVEVGSEQALHPISVVLRDRSRRFALTADRLALCAVRDTVSRHDVVVAERSCAHDAEAAERLERAQRLLARGTDRNLSCPPHDGLSHLACARA